MTARPRHAGGEAPPLVDDESIELAALLLKTAGKGALPEIRRFGSHSNEHYLVGDGEGDRYVLRRFKDNKPPHSPLARMERECWVSEMLVQVGAPVPPVVVRSAEPG